MNKDIKPEDMLTGVKNLSESAVIAVSEISESLHQSIASLGGLLDSSEQTRGITGLVYGHVRGITRLSSALLDPPLRLLGARLPQLAQSEATLAVIAALNGVLGDHLQAIHHPFALAMSLRANGEDVLPQHLAARTQSNTGTINLFVHGLCMNDLQWQRRPGSYGDILHRHLDTPAVYLRYNTGLHISQNGKYLAELLQEVDAHLPPHVQLNILAHSMGGLVTRAALHTAETQHMVWPRRVRHIAFFGTPHHGAPLEKVGHWIDHLLDFTPYSRPFARLTRLRSSGINDLREGFIVERDWQSGHTGSAQRTAVPLPAHIACYSFAASTTAKQPSGKKQPGDGLVSVASALGQHAQTTQDLHIPATQQHLITHANHMDLLSHPEVAEVLLRVLR